jgi:hypothetical protein
MTLQEVLNDIENLGEDDVIFARKPWVLDTEAEIGHLNVDYGIPATMTSRGLAYFLEVFVAREEVLDGLQEYPLSNAERFAAVVYYAEFDAYPEWLSERIRAFQNVNPEKATERVQ